MFARLVALDDGPDILVDRAMTDTVYDLTRIGERARQMASDESVGAGNPGGHGVPRSEWNNWAGAAAMHRALTMLALIWR